MTFELEDGNMLEVARGTDRIYLRAMRAPWSSLTDPEAERLAIALVAATDERGEIDDDTATHRNGRVQFDSFKWPPDIAEHVALAILRAAARARKENT